MAKVKPVKPHGTDDEVLYLISRRREEARAAIREILAGFLNSARFPRVECMVDYLFNMAICIELMLKLLTGMWDDHDLKTKYTEAFKRDYGKPDLLESLKQAMTNQKYLFKPSEGLADRIPEIEDLFDELYDAIAAKYRMYQLDHTFKVPRLGEYLKKVAPLFHRTRAIAAPKEGHTMHDVEVERIRQHIDLFVKSNGEIEFEASAAWSIDTINDNARFTLG